MPRERYARAVVPGRRLVTFPAGKRRVRRPTPGVAGCRSRAHESAAHLQDMRVCCTKPPSYGRSCSAPTGQETRPRSFAEHARCAPSTLTELQSGGPPGDRTLNPRTKRALRPSCAFPWLPICAVQGGSCPRNLPRVLAGSRRLEGQAGGLMRVEEVTPTSLATGRQQDGCHVRTPFVVQVNTAA